MRNLSRHPIGASIGIVAVCALPFAISGCGGGGGGGGGGPPPPVILDPQPPPPVILDPLRSFCPQGQVGTPPDCAVPALPIVGILRTASSTEGSPVEFTLTRAGDASAALAVQVSVSETGEMVAAANKGARTVTFTSGSRTAVLTVPTIDDTVDEHNSVVSALIAADSSRYILGTTFKDRATVEDDDASTGEPVWEATWSGTALTEGGASLTVTLRNTNPQSVRTRPDLISMHFGRSESTADADDIVVTQDGKTTSRHETGPDNKHHNGGWEYIGEFGAVARISIAAVTNDGAEAAETLAVWIDADNRDISSRILTIASSSDSRLQGQLRSVETDAASFPALSVADASVNESPGATLDFTVSLSRPFAETVTVRYATSDGTATAGSDYTAISGALTFRANETSKTVSVPVLDDARDEGAETLTLTLSNPDPSRVKLADATATGTIDNADAMPRAWIARFGRIAAEQVLDAMESRMRAARRPGVEVSLAGERIGRRPGSGDGAAAWNRAGAPGRDSATGKRAAGERTPSVPALASGRAVTQRELLLGSSFAATAEVQGSVHVSVWGRGAVSRFDGRNGGLSVDGEVASGMIGADWTRGRATAGLIAGHGAGEGGYREPSGGSGASGVVSSTLTGVYPWGRYALSERVEAWGAAGYGEGTLTLTPEGEDAMRTDLDLWMAAAGLRGVLIDGDGFALAAKTDALTVTTSTDAVPGLAASEAGATRLRLGLEGTLTVRLADGSVLTPSAEIGVRHDGGDAETGFGADIGAGIAWRDPKRGLAAELRGRGVLAHESKGFRERGLAGSLGWDPAPGGRGPRFSLVQTIGGPSPGGADTLPARGTLTRLAASGNGNGDPRGRRLEARFGYGFAAFGDRYISTPEVGVGLSGAGRDHSLGWRLSPIGRVGDGSLELSVKARRRESANDDNAPEHRAGVRLTARF